MFNQNDCSSSEWAACCKAAEAIPSDPRDYFEGLPDPFLLVPRNTLLFSRREAMDLEPGTAHHRFLLILCLEGEGSVIVDDAVARMKPGLALLVAPLQFHHYARFSGERLLWLFLSFELDEVGELEPLRGRVLPLSPVQVTCVRQLAARYAALGGRLEACPAISLLAALLLEEFRGNAALESPDEAAPQRLIQKVARYVHHHVSKPIRIPDVARAVGISESRLRARFRAVAGIGLGAYIQRLRLHRARNMLLASVLPLKIIAERCGYDSIYSFSRAFRREAGITPSLYRKSGGLNPGAQRK